MKNHQSMTNVQRKLDSRMVSIKLIFNKRKLILSFPVIVGSFAETTVKFTTFRLTPRDFRKS